MNANDFEFSPQKVELGKLDFLVIFQLLCKINFSCFFRDLPPSQGGRYQGFGNSVDPPPKSSSTNDFYDASLNGITNVRLLKVLINFRVGLCFLLVLRKLQVKSQM